jgi:hypothetical protein
MPLESLANQHERREKKWQALANVFAFARVSRLPVFSNRVVEFTLFFNTAHPVATSFNNARTIDSVPANGLEANPGGPGIMAVLAAHNLRRGLAMGLPGGQGAANHLGITPLGYLRRFAKRWS